MTLRSYKMKPYKMIKVIDGKRYNTSTATLIASDAYWDGNNWERKGTNMFLYRTDKGNYFLFHMTQWQGDVDRIEPIAESEAIHRFEMLEEQEVTFEVAFPGVAVEDA